MKLHTAVFVHLDLGDLDWAHQLPLTTQLSHGVFRAKARWCWELLKAREWLQGASQLGRVSGKGDAGNAIERCQSRCWWWKGRFILLFDCLLLNLMLMFFLTESPHSIKIYAQIHPLPSCAVFFNVALHTGAYKNLWSPVLQIGNVISNLEMHVMCYCFTILSFILSLFLRIWRNSWINSALCFVIWRASHIKATTIRGHIGLPKQVRLILQFLVYMVSGIEKIPANNKLFCITVGHIHCWTCGWNWFFWGCISG
jgi:hypothetical protein